MKIIIIEVSIVIEEAAFLKKKKKILNQTLVQLWKIWDFFLQVAQKK